MSPQPGTFDAALIELDNESGITDLRFADGSTVWLTLRFSLRMLYFHKDDNSASTVSPAANESFKKYLIHALRFNPFRFKKHVDILTVANYEGNPECPNRMTWFLREIPELSHTALLYSAKNRRFKGLKQTGNFDYFYFSVLWQKKWRRKPEDASFRKASSAFLIKVSERLAEFVPAEKVLKVLNDLCHINDCAVAYHQKISRYLKTVKPKLLLVSEGNNGDWKSGILFHAAHQQNIPIAEVQHGAFNIGMWYGKKLIEKLEFRAQKTDYQFVFGAYHCKRMNAAPVCIPMGHYQLEVKGRNLPEYVASDTLKLLYIAEGIPPSAVANGLVIQTIAGLKLMKKPFELVIRLHPSEVRNAKYEGLIQFPGSRYSEFRNEDIYALINACDVVIGHTSTVLYEALKFGKAVMVYKDKESVGVIPETLGKWFSDGNELAENLDKWQPENQNADQQEEFWAGGNYADNFRNFWNEYILKQK